MSLYFLILQQYTCAKKNCIEVYVVELICLSFSCLLNFTPYLYLRNHTEKEATSLTPFFCKAEALLFL